MAQSRRRKATLKAKATGRKVGAGAKKATKAGISGVNRTRGAVTAARQGINPISGKKSKRLTKAQGYSPGTKAGRREAAGRGVNPYTGRKNRALGKGIQTKNRVSGGMQAVSQGVNPKTGKTNKTLKSTSKAAGKTTSAVKSIPSGVRAQTKRVGIKKNPTKRMGPLTSRGATLSISPRPGKTGRTRTVTAKSAGYKGNRRASVTTGGGRKATGRVVNGVASMTTFKGATKSMKVSTIKRGGAGAAAAGLGVVGYKIYKHRKNNVNSNANDRDTISTARPGSRVGRRPWPRKK